MLESWVWWNEIYFYSNGSFQKLVRLRTAVPTQYSIFPQFQTSIGYLTASITFRDEIKN